MSCLEHSSRRRPAGTSSTSSAELPACKSSAATLTNRWLVLISGVISPHVSKVPSLSNSDLAACNRAKQARGGSGTVREWSEGQ